MGEQKTSFDLAKEYYQDLRQVVFLGPPGSGKTVVATLIKQALYAKDGFLEKFPDFEANLIKGNDFLAATEENMFSGNFPSPTPQQSVPEVIFRINRKGALGTGVDLRIHDISGEDYRTLCLGDNTNHIHSIMESHKEKPESSFGPMTFLIFANLYVILIDCQEFSNWNKLDLRQSQLLNTLLKFDVSREISTDGKISSPLAILLTKTDTLTEEDDGSPEELISKNMPQFDKTLKMLHKGKRAFFKVYVDPQPDKDNNIQKEIQQVKNPLSYSKDEYVRFIKWIIENIPK